MYTYYHCGLWVNCFDFNFKRVSFRFHLITNRVFYKQKLFLLIYKNKVGKREHIEGGDTKKKKEEREGGIEKLNCIQIKIRFTKGKNIC